MGRSPQWEPLRGLWTIGRLDEKNFMLLSTTMLLFLLW